MPGMSSLRENMMISYYCCDILRRGAVLLSICLISAIATAAAAPDECIKGEARIVGKEILFFSDSDEQVSVIRGGFKLTLGDRIISGTDAVVWVQQYKDRGVNRNKITAYVEGDAKVVEPGGTTNDKIMLVVVNHQGRLSAPSVVSSPKLKDSPIYKRAIAQRRHAEARDSELAAAQQRKVAVHAPPRLIRPDSKPPAPPKMTRRKRTGAEKPTEKTAKKTPTKEPEATSPVHFHADKLKSKLLDNGRRVTVVRGNVYLCQGNAGSDSFLELRSHSAVIVSRRYSKDTPAPKKDSRSPMSTKMPDASEAVVGVYLEGDVVISRGERYMRSETAYYDFTSDRAIIPNVVFRTVQEQRDIPIYIRADEARTLSAREMVFRNAKVSTSDFHTPTYHIGAKKVYLMDTAPYDEKGVRLSQQSWLIKMKHSTFNVRGVPVMYWPYVKEKAEQGHSALRRAKIESDSTKGFGVSTEWHLFRLLGMVKPSWLDVFLTLDWHENSYSAAIDYEYERNNFSGYGGVHGLVDQTKQDDFGDERKDIDAPGQRGRVLVRHKHILPDDWQMQFELAYMCDANFLEREFQDEFHAGKEQETLIYAKKQRDNWAFTSLLQARLNRFDTQTESLPDVGFHLIGQPLFGDRLTFFSESHAGVKRWRPANDLKIDDSGFFGRFDTRNEINMPLKIGPINAVPFAMARATYWSDSPEDGANFRPYTQAGIRANTHIWAVYDNVHSRLWDVNRLKHIITPEVTAFIAGAGGVAPHHLYPMDPDIEEHMGRLSGMSFGVHQRLQTKRGKQDDGTPYTVDWMRLDVVASVFDTSVDQVPCDGRFFPYRPENSMGRNSLNVDYTWNISDSTTLMADANFDIDRGVMGRGGIALAVSRDPRLRYFLGLRTIQDMDSSALTAGFRYKLNKKYTFSFFQQYDFDFNSGQNSATSFSIIRKLPRWYVGFTLKFDQRQDDTSFMLTFWPEGIDEVEFSTGNVSIYSKSDRN